MVAVRRGPVRGNVETIPVNLATAAAHIIKSPTSGKALDVLGFHLVAAGAVAVTGSIGATAFTGGAMSLITGVPNSYPPTTVSGAAGGDVVPIASGAVDEALTLTLGGAVQVSGWVQVQERDA